MAQNKKYWRGVQELENPELVQALSEREFAEDLPTDKFLGDEAKLSEGNTSRRDFLKYMGFTTAAATLAACESPIQESLPYVVAPEEVIPGIANYYASSYFDGHDYASILIKTREGRPIKVENNKLASINGGANARVHASVLNLYDATRLQKPLVEGKESDWQALDAKVVAGLDAALAAGKDIVILTASVISPSQKVLFNKLKEKYSNLKHVQADQFSVSAKLDAWNEATGKRALPQYSLDQAKVIVSVGADFLSDWTGQSLSADYAKRRQPGQSMGRHLQFEANLSLTGSNADQRYKVRASEYGEVLIALHNEIAKAKGGVTLSGASSKFQKAAAQAAKELLAAGSEALVLSGGNDKDAELITIAINEMLGGDGTTYHTDKRIYLRQGNSRALAGLVKDIEAGKVGALINHNLNPAYTYSSMADWSKLMAKVPVSVTVSQKNDETAQLSTVVAAENHYLESWGDHNPADNQYSVQQPTIKRLFNTRQFEECLMAWAGESGDYLSFMRNNWSNLLGDKPWSAVLHDGVFSKSMASDLEVAESNANDTAAEQAEARVDLNASAQRLAKQAKGIGKYELNFYQKVGMGTGVLANNPWLLEFPDPITRVSWDNYLTISASDANELGFKNWNESNGALNGNYATLTVNGKRLEKVPVYIQPGQTQGSVGLAVGFGRKGAGDVADKTGVNAYPLFNESHYADVKIELEADSEHGFACVQLAHTMMGRDIVKEVDLDTFLNEEAQTENHKGWNEPPIFETHKGPLSSEETNLWDDFDHETGHMWNMSIDLNLCNGCGACVIACHAENNVPVVGKDEVRRSRDMHWLRIDRYYSSDTTEETAEEKGQGAIDMYADMELPSENPQVFFQPVMCQHCNHAPCETVCPVAATTHSAEGLNHMTYNRCIGTRYCANNCPYKVRRFNWFLYHDNEKFSDNYSMNDDLGRMVLNPDVTVRSRGVMEKCSMCIQRIQLGKLEAKKSGKALKDGSVKTACQSACDTNAIVFGDVNDKESKVFQLKQDKRMYHLLGSVGTQPSVFYQVKVRNTKA